MAASSNAYRLEKDSMGPIQVPKEAYYGAQTQRAIENFPISGWRFGRELIYALGLIKQASAETNAELGLIEKRIASAIMEASDRGDAREMGRTLYPGRLSNRLGHLNQHERQ